MSEDKNRVTQKDAKDLVEAQKSLMLEQKLKFEQEARETREEFVEMKFQVPLSLAGNLAKHYGKIYRKWEKDDE